MSFDPKQRAYPMADGEWKPFIQVDADGVRFTGQKGPIKDVGLNGCQIDDMIVFARKTLEAFNQHVSSRETAIAITKLQEAEHWLLARTRNREKRGVEGTDRA